MMPLHVVPRASEILYVLEGELTAYLPGVSRVLRRGKSMYQPVGVPQTHRVTSSEAARVLAITGSRGVVFEEYDTPELTTVDGILTEPGGDRAAWFKDSEGNVLGLVQIS
jgi:quercetin dioxygenase-like cupin family protein